MATDDRGINANDDEIDVEPRSPDEIAGRLAVLVTMQRRIEIDLALHDDSDVDRYTAETDRFDLLSWTRIELKPWLGDEEMAFLRKPAGRLTNADIAAHATDLDAAYALGWALRLVPSPRLPVGSLLHEPTDLDQVLEWAPAPWDRVADKARRLSLRPAEEVWLERERWFAYWLRTTVSALPPGERDAVVRDLVEDAVNLGVPLKGKDLDFAGHSYGDLTDDQQDRAAAVAHAYVHALTWACGFGESWINVPIDEI